MIIKTSLNPSKNSIEKYAKLLTNLYPKSIKKSTNSLWNLKFDQKLGC
jgi:hypothetical protein